ncbi:putative HD superfamily hydrolase involved in NAD metabolism [Pullulanibacillus pueri]|uniref:bis(5'-nucleosyl)-tetraphosphatase (symmetrical) n=1 Tax=Pullulanibacillus pueri TaxID=1437324 RepID=A0A8J3EMY6_9BACL|nr:bis(5'-nucleosyl)-tetraphosphatase (symmetrical) YqeK [Pullulanibacillus pueri]MBM7683075.1 putative HD superfamily hydrolase involved in NAD metabolism [Pullulanibacillus pueri]GGH84883.1 hypothetical protein GCM10007096_28980 [Pullulanibacillus pueri]
MTKEEVLKIIKERLPEKRYEHTLRVTDTAIVLAEKYGEDPQKAELASLLHDIAKYFSEQELYETITQHPEVPNTFLHYHPSIWHAPVGAVYAQEHLGILDMDILNAITYHTTGREGMSLLEKIVFLADYIEPGRHFPGVDEVRTLAESDLDQAVAKALANTIQYLVGKYASVFPDTIHAYNDLVTKVGKELQLKEK